MTSGVSYVEALGYKYALLKILLKEMEIMVENVMTSSTAGVAQSRSADVVLRTINLSKRYGQRLAVDNLNLEVYRGEIVGFLGPNGAGKTTTIRMALGLITPTSGSVEILGQDVATHKAHILPRVGALIETPALYLYMSGRDNLRAAGAVLGGVPKARIEAVLNMVGLQARQRDRVRTYSLGMKQRLGVAMALLQDPDVLILDEPANGLDPAGIVEMRDLLHRLASEGKTVFVSSHLLSEVQQLCTRVAIVNLGKLITESSVEDLVKGQGEFAVTLERTQDALTLLRTQTWGKNARIEAEVRNNTLVTSAPDGRGRSLNLFLVNAGFAPDAITPAVQDLEQVFLRLTHNDAGGVQ